jgi:hypothetical protein
VLKNDRKEKDGFAGRYFCLERSILYFSVDYFPGLASGVHFSTPGADGQCSNVSGLFNFF